MLTRAVCILLVLLLLAPVPAWAVTMSLGAASANANGSVTPLNITYAGTTTGRGMVCAFEFQGNASTITSVTVGSDTATLLTHNNNATLGYSTRMAYVPAMTGTGSQTISTVWTGGGNVIYGICQELYSDTTGIALDGSNQATGNSTTPTTSVTTGSANSALIGFAIEAAGPLTVGSGFTSIVTGSVWNFESFERNLDAGAAGAKTVDYTTTSGQWAISAAGFTASGGAAALPSNLLLMGIGGGR